MQRKRVARRFERYFKGVANHRRIEILLLVTENPGILLEGIANRLNCNLKTTSVHAQKLVQAGLVDKKYKGRAVEHSLSPHGKTMVKFIQKFPSS